MAQPKLIEVNLGMGQLLGLTLDEMSSPDFSEICSGNRTPQGSKPIALAYAGHQFGHFVPQLGDGRAILIGEVVGKDGQRYDIQLKGAGPTVYSRHGDGRAALGPVLREYVVSEAMAALGVPTTRALAAVTTGEWVYRDIPLPGAVPGAVLTRVASSHLRIGTFQYFAARNDQAAITHLIDYALERHYPNVPTHDGKALALLDAVMRAQASLVARWLSLGFVHGVMNTDNISIAGETLDYGPCAFLDGYDPQRTFSSIDQHGRYAFDNQPRIALWNLARFAETLLSAIDDNTERATSLVSERLSHFGELFRTAYTRELCTKLGLTTPRSADVELIQSLLGLLAKDRVDHTLFFRQLYAIAGGAEASLAASLFPEPQTFYTWLPMWQKRFDEDSEDRSTRTERMRLVNPAYIPRNHLIENMIDAATQGDFAPLHRLNRVLAHPYDDQPDTDDLVQPPGQTQWAYRTYCGT